MQVPSSMAESVTHGSHTTPPGDAKCELQKYAIRGQTIIMAVDVPPIRAMYTDWHLR